ncbi:MAG: hypothetical protein HY952_00610 [Elusimicrobia bacterium]|nr:hypothetical protein [Elusimicrobiota bacterium]
MAKVEEFITKEQSFLRKYHTIALWNKFKNHADNHFENEFCSGDWDKCNSRYWELALGCWLLDANAYVHPNRGDSVDFKIRIENSDIALEAICPTCGDKNNRIPPCPPATNSEKITSYNVPVKEVQLRWLSAFHKKSKKIKEYISSGKVLEGEYTIIAINGCQLGVFGSEGISQFHPALECVYALGPQQLLIDPRNTKNIKHSIQYSPLITNANGADIRKDAFLSKDHSHISALLVSNRHANDPDSDMILVHNINAKNPFPHKKLPVNQEYSIERTEQEYTIKKL